MRRCLFWLAVISSVLIFAQETRIRDVSPILDIYEPVSFVVQKGIMELDENSNFRGGLLTTRFDIAQYLYKLVKNFKLEQLLVDVEGLKKSSVEFSTRFAGLESAYKVASERLNQLETALNNLNNKVEGLSNELAAQISMEIQNALKQFADAKRIEELVTRIDSLEKQVTSVDKQISDVRTQVSTLAGRHQATEDNLQALSDKVMRLETKQDSVGKDISALKMELASLKTKLDEQVATLEKLKNDVENRVALSEKLMDDKLTNALNKFDVNLKNLTSDVSLQRKELADLTQNLLGLRGQIEMLQKTIDLLEINATKKQVADLQALVEETRKRVEQTNVNLQNFEERLAAMDISVLERKISELEARQTNTENSMMTAYLLGGVGAAIGVLALIFSLGK